ncbi:hypothetical protein ZIOFF_030974 [Zingiber officinale]|uniref:Uncharacterized protein n=1 Tax=Zingiber officinale TaxID=94328 RepID=A0A8J5GS34_ZINOF|nr:hypothetical protein ZIOFF_030974 [Zingiber officinale]
MRDQGYRRHWAMARGRAAVEEMARARDDIEGRWQRSSEANCGRGLVKLMEGEHTGPFNLGNPGDFTMLELANVVQDMIDPNAKIEFKFRPNTARHH